MTWIVLAILLYVKALDSGDLSLFDRIGVELRTPIFWVVALFSFIAIALLPLYGDVLGANQLVFKTAPKAVNLYS